MHRDCLQPDHLAKGMLGKLHKQPFTKGNTNSMSGKKAIEFTHKYKPDIIIAYHRIKWPADTLTDFTAVIRLEENKAGVSSMHKQSCT
jgi:hypothetical protein